MKNIIVTGGAGFIGSHTCLALLERGYRVFVIDSFINSSPLALEKVLEILKNKNKNVKDELIIFKCDLKDKSLLKNIFSEIKTKYKTIDGVIHFAGLKSVAESISFPLIYWQANVFGTINLIEIMQKYKCNTLVFSSSATIYANSENPSLSENDQLMPSNPYGNTKLSIEVLLNDIFNSSKMNLKFASLRYFNPIGAHISGLIGENPKGKPNNIFPLIINTAMGTQKKLEIYGNDWPTKDGTPIRDYIHVMDLADAHIKVLENLFKNESIFLELNIGTGRGTSVLELIKIFEKVNCVKVPYIFVNRRPGDNCSIVADNSLLISKFNIVPKLKIEDMCRDGWNWKKLNPNGY